MRIPRLSLCVTVVGGAVPALRLHPENPRYFEWRGKPTVLICSGEHYGAVLNLDFDFVKYLDALQRDGLNATRTFTGAGYAEPQNAFNITKNTLAPNPERFLAPWARSDQPGASDGGTKWDLKRWNEAWDFMLAGGALFKHLDYSFAAGHEDGTFVYPPAQPGGGGPAVRAQFGILKRFIEGFDFLRLKPAAVTAQSGEKSLSVRVLGDPGKAYAAYIHRSAAPGWKNAQKLNRGSFENEFSLDVPAGEYQAEWIEPATGETLRTERLQHAGGAITLTTPPFKSDLALRLRSQ